MCTCGIDIATQQATPATHSSTMRVFGDRPSDAGVPRGAVAGDRIACRRPDGAAPRASGSIVTAQNTPMPTWVARQPAVCDEVLDDRRPDRAGEIVAAGRRSPPRCRAACRTSARCRRSAARTSPSCRSRSAARARARTARCWPRTPTARSRAPSATAPISTGTHDAEAVGQPAHHDAADAEADHGQRVRQRGVGARDAEFGLHRRQRDRRPTTCRRCRPCRAPAPGQAAARHRRS